MRDLADYLTLHVDTADLRAEHPFEIVMTGYVATMLGEVRQLRTDPVLRRLRSDLHPVIRGKLSGVEPKDER